MNRYVRLITVTVMLVTTMSYAHAADESAMDRVLASGTIRCGYFLWPTYISKDPNTKKLSGINYEIMEAVGKNLGLKVEWAAEVGAGDAAAGLDTDKFDVMCATVWPSPGRVKSMTLTLPTFYNVAYAYVRAGDTRFDGDLSKANKKTVTMSGIDGDSTADLALETLPEARAAMLSQMASGGELLMQLVSKKADIIFAETGMVNEFTQTHPNTVRQVAGIGPVRYYGESLAVKRGEMELKNMLDISLMQLTNDGIIDRIVDKYRADYKATFYPPSKFFVKK